MNPLESRKKLLLAESELNRAQLVQEWRTLADEAHALTTQAKTIGAIAAAATLLLKGLLSFQHKKPAPVEEKCSWLQTIIKGAGLASKFWATFRSQAHTEKDN